MPVSLKLPPDIESWALAEVAAGRADSVETLVADALRQRRDRDAYVAGKIEEARQDAAAGRVSKLDDVLSRGSERVAQLRAGFQAAE